MSIINVIAAGDYAEGAVRELAVVAMICVGIAVLWAIIRSATRSAIAPPPPPAPAAPILAFPVSPSTTPHRYRIVGVDKETRMEVTDTIEATTADNARVKAELSGVVVTKVEPA